MIKRLIGCGIVAVTVLLAVYVGYSSWQNAKLNPDTDEASVSAPIVTISSVVPGLVLEVLVENNQYVEEGDVLFRIDPEPYLLEVAQAKAVLATAQSELEQGGGNLALLQSNADVAQQQIKRAEHNLAWAQATLARLEPLLASNYVTAQEVDTARTAVRDALVTLEQSQAAATGSQAVVGNLDTRMAQVELAEASLRLAERNLAHTTRVAPRNGLISGLQLTEGEFILGATPLFSLIDNSKWTVSALYRETELAQIKVGARAQVFLLSAPELALEGRVSSISWGVRSTEEANILGLPIVASSLNWVRSARRYPVEIELLDPPAEFMRLSATASVRILNDP